MTMGSFCQNSSGRPSCAKTASTIADWHCLAEAGFASKMAARSPKNEQLQLFNTKKINLRLYSCPLPRRGAANSSAVRLTQGAFVLRKGPSLIPADATHRAQCLVE